jgi:hypothetical protein
MDIVRLRCEQLPGVTILGIGRPYMQTEYVAHASQFVGLLRGITDKKACCRAYRALLEGDCGRKLKEQDGCDLLTAVQNGALKMMMYSYLIRGGSPSIFVTVEGIKEIMDKLPNADEAVKSKLQEIFTVDWKWPVTSTAGQSLMWPVTPTAGQSLITNAGVYVLRITSRPKPFFYVGKAENIERRIQQHVDGVGAYCIAGEPFTREKLITDGILNVPVVYPVADLFLFHRKRQRHGVVGAKRSSRPYA